MSSRSPAHFLAPLALVVAFIAFVVVLSSSSGDDGPGSARRATPATPATTSSASRSQSRSETTARRARSYTVKAGDTLSVIAEKTGVGVPRLVELNPDVDPQGLRAGQKIKLVR